VTKFVKQEHICQPRDQVADLSTSLLGVFEIEHLKIELTEEGKRKYNEYCPPDFDAKVPIYKGDYVWNFDRHFWSISIGDIDNVDVSYQRGDMPFKAKCLVIHTPMKWNFWHFSIRWRVDDEFWHNLDSKAQRKLAKRLGHEARSHIAKFAKAEVPNCYPLEEINYLKASA
ncbi:MAG: hypothetical protein RIA63_15090, partial [Cyclobacteriaceae bacterium]